MRDFDAAKLISFACPMDPGHVNLINKFGGITKYTKAVQLLTKSPENGFRVSV